MNMPEMIKIGGVRFKVIVEEELVDVEADGKRVPVNGYIKHDSCAVGVRAGLAHDQTCLVFLHEISHGLFSHFSREDMNDETVVMMLAEGLLMIIRDNPDLMAFLMNGGDDGQTV